jgi:hypothetical protein
MIIGLIIGLQLTDRRYNCSLIDGTSICLCPGDECPNAEHCGPSEDTPLEEE